MMNDVIHTKALAAVGTLFQYEEAFINQSNALSQFATETHFSQFQLVRNELREAEQMASIMMHHDAITGTNTISTLNDYKYRISEVNKLLANIKKTIFGTLNKL